MSRCGGHVEACLSAGALTCPVCMYIHNVCIHIYTTYIYIYVYIYINTHICYIYLNSCRKTKGSPAFVADTWFECDCDCARVAIKRCLYVCMYVCM